MAGRLDLRTGVPGGAGRLSGRCRVSASAGLPSLRNWIFSAACNSRNCCSAENGNAARMRARQRRNRPPRSLTCATAAGSTAGRRKRRPVIGRAPGRVPSGTGVLTGARSPGSVFNERRIGCLQSCQWPVLRGASRWSYAAAGSASLMMGSWGVFLSLSMRSSVGGWVCSVSQMNGTGWSWMRACVSRKSASSSPCPRRAAC
jgi:hypothetical protein